MRLARNITLTIAAITAFPVLSTATGDNNQPFTITISAPKLIVQTGERTRIHVVLTNISNKTIVIDGSAAPDDADEYYNIQVHDKNGNVAPESDAFVKSGRRIVSAGSEIAFDLEPGKKVEEDGYLNGIYDLPPGEYEVQFSRPVSYDPNAEIVQSNIITITVTSSTLLSGTQISTMASGPSYNRGTKLFYETLTIKNIGSKTISGPFQIVLISIPSGMTLANATGNFGGSPYITLPNTTSLGPGQSASVILQFSNPANVLIPINPMVYSGSFQ